MKVSYGIHVFLSLVSLFILINVYQYLEKLKSCSCFLEKQNPHYKINVDFLQLYQILEIISLFIFVTFLGIYKRQFGIGSRASRKTGMKFFILLSAILFLFITGYVSYQSLLLYFMSKKDCQCLNEWPKYIVYVQGVFNSIYFLRLLLLFIFVCILFVFNFMK